VVLRVAAGETWWNDVRMDPSLDEVAVLVRQAMLAENLSAFTDLLDPDVTWGAPGARNPSCKSRDQVLEWYQRGRNAGVRGSVHDVEILGDRLLVSMNVRGPEHAGERAGPALRFQVLTVRSGRIVEIVGFDEKTEALSYAG
jgi:ketosteroid isomerase-like protein